jgi:hypothetical protein
MPCPCNPACRAGKWAGYSVVAFQQIASLGNNITLGIVAGVSMKVSRTASAGAA